MDLKHIETRKSLQMSNEITGWIRNIIEDEINEFDDDLEEDHECDKKASMLNFIDTKFYTDGSVSMDKMCVWVDELIKAQHIANPHLEKAILSDIEYNVLKDYIEYERALYDMMVATCFLCGCDEEALESGLCKRHHCMLSVSLSDIRLQHALPVQIKCPCEDCPERSKVKRINVLVNLLKACKDDRDKKISIIKKQFYPTNGETCHGMNKAHFECLFMCVVQSMDTQGTLENLENSVESGEINEEKYLDICYMLKLVHEVQNKNAGYGND
jgi:hypothetical protein